MDTTGNGHDEDEFFLEMSDDSSSDDGVQGDEGATDVCYMEEEELPLGDADLATPDSSVVEQSVSSAPSSIGVLDGPEYMEATEVLDQEAPQSEPSSGGDVSNAAYAQLLSELEAMKAERDKYKDQLIRKAADLDNYRKRVAREREDQKRYGNEKFAQELLPVVDNMERALNAFSGEEVEVKTSLKDGVDMVYKQLLSALKRFGVESFESKGTPFDPQKHEAIQQVESTEEETGIILDVFQKGYFINDRLLRPAMVSVAKNTEG